MSLIVKKPNAVEVLPKEDPLVRVKEGMKISLEQTAELANVVRGNSRISVTMIQNVFSDEIFNLAIDIAKKQLREEYRKELEMETTLIDLSESSGEAIDRIAQLCRSMFPDRSVWDAMKFLFLRRILMADVLEEEANSYLNLQTTTYRMSKLLHDLRKKMTPKEAALFISEPGAMKVTILRELFPQGIPESVWVQLVPNQRKRLHLVPDHVAYGGEKRGEITENAESIAKPSRDDQQDHGGHGDGSPENSGRGTGGG